MPGHERLGLRRHDPALAIVLARDAQYADKGGAHQQPGRATCPSCCRAWCRSFEDRVRAAGRAFAYHPPCTLQRGQKRARRRGAAYGGPGLHAARARTESHLCCGAAGTYGAQTPGCRGSCASASWRPARPLPTPPAAILSANMGLNHPPARRHRLSPCATGWAAGRGIAGMMVLTRRAACAMPRVSEP